MNVNNKQNRRTQTIPPSRSPLSLTCVGRAEWVFSDQDEPEELREMFDLGSDLVDDGKDDRAKPLLEAVLKINPDHIDAMHHLAIIYDARGDRKRSRLLWERGVKTGRAAIPKRFKRGSSRITWGHLENRPFLRCIHGHALALYHDGRTDEALAALREMLDYNPQDNLGAREIILDVLLETGRYGDALAHTDRYNDAGCPTFTYGRTLSLFMLGSLQEADAALSGAVKGHPRVAKEMGKRTHVRPADCRPGYISPGGRDEAYEYWESQGRFWPKEAIRWLRGRLKAATKENGGRKPIHGGVRNGAG